VGEQLTLQTKLPSLVKKIEKSLCKRLTDNNDVILSERRLDVLLVAGHRLTRARLTIASSDCSRTTQALFLQVSD